MQTLQSTINEKLQQILDERKESSLYRYLQVQEGLVDFCSNDYLGFARSQKIKERIKKYAGKIPGLTGSTGSRSISGNTLFAEQLEKRLAAFHHADAALLFNSGYDANVGFFSSIAGKNDTLICDELIHASIIDGCRLSYANRFKFAHNDLGDLEKKLKQAKGNIFVAVESVYSMDGDMAPLIEMAAICNLYNANLVVDEAHATGVFGENGRGLVNEYKLEKPVFARIHTFGKAIGCHGAVVVGSETLRNYLVNFARSFIFTTALPFHSLIAIESAYEELMTNSFDNSYLFQLIQHFKKDFFRHPEIFLKVSNSPVQSLIIPGNGRVRGVSRQLQARGLDVRAIVSPSVPPGKERLRISLHIHNTTEQVDLLKQSLKEIVFA